jgi:hypothetical protein
MSQTLEQYLRDELANSGAIDFSLRASVSDGSVRFYIHPTNRAGMTVDFEIKGNTLIPPGGLYGDAVRPVPAPLLGEDGALLVAPIGSAYDLAASVAP